MLVPEWVGLRTPQAPVGLSKELSCEAGSFSHCHFNSHGCFNQRFEALFPRAGALGCAVCFAPHHSSWFILVRMWGCWVLPAALPAPFSTTLSLASLFICARMRGRRVC